MAFKERISSWVGVLLSPAATFKKEHARASYKSCFVNLFSAALISSIFNIFFGTLLAVFKPNAVLVLARQTGAFSIQKLTSLSPANAAVSFAVDLGVMLVIILALWVFGGSIACKLSKIIGGKGDLKTQLYLTSIFAPGFLFMSTILSFAGALMISYLIFAAAYSVFLTAISVWFILLLLVLIYGIYCYVSALIEAHEYNPGAGIATCLISAIIIGAIVAIAVLTTTGAVLRFFIL